MPRFGKEARSNSSQFGPLNKYIITYKNYVGITSCSECGLYGVLPTWTRPPLFTNTPTPAPTKTTSLPSSTPTETATLAPIEVTETYSMFELLYGTETLTSTPSESPTPTPLPTILPAAVETTSEHFDRSHESGAGLWDWAGDHPGHSGIPDLDFQHALKTEITTLDPSCPHRRV